MRRLSAVLVGLAMAACASSGEGVDVAKPAPTDALAYVPQSGLGPQELVPGECGLFLWSKTDPSKFIFFTKAVSGRALLSHQDSALALSQTEAGGTIFGQFNTRVSYMTETGMQIALVVTPGDDLEGGQRIESGLITMTDTDGWQTKLPVLGVRACQTE